MNAPDFRLNPHLDAAIQRLRTAAEQAAERCAEGLGMAALSAGNMKKRDALLAAQFVFRKQQSTFGHQFYQSLRNQIATEQHSSAAAAAPVPAHKKKDWSELSLMDDDQVDALVAADRIGLALGHHSEWELREVESYVFGVSQGERNPLRPELVGAALLEGVNAVSEDSQTRELLIDEMTRAMAQEMRGCYADIAELFRNRGLRPQDLRVRGADSHSPSRNQPLSQQSAHGEFDSRHGGHPSGHGGHHSGHGSGHGGFNQTGYGQQGGYPQGGHGGHGGAQGGGYGPRGGFGVVDPQMMDLLRRLAQTPFTPGGGMGGMGGNSGFHPSQAGGFEPSGFGDGGPGVDWSAVPLPPNLILQHRDELRQASTGRLDHMVIDVVGSLFDQILSDNKVPPQMARLVARLQLPVLRVALGDSTFFSSRRHPVRRFVNRMASLACAYDDFSEDPGRAFLQRVRELVQDVAEGDFDRIDVYEAKLDELEAFIAEQTAATLKAQGDAASLVERKEIDLRLQQKYMQQLTSALGPVPVAPFLRDFLSQVWSQAIVLANREGAPEREQRLRTFGRDLVMSVQPKSGTAARQAFLGQLPSLMRTLNEGLDLIQWPEPARKGFFAELLPAHAESLKGQALSALETNLLSKQLEAVFGVAPPNEKDLPAPSASGSTVGADMDVGARLTEAEARSLGLMDEAGVDWNGQVDIEIVIPPGEHADVPLLSEEISLEGLPAIQEAPEPVDGELLIDHLQLGFAYRMNVGDEWKKVRLAHISAGRSFFIFTQGSKHQETVTMTARMLKRMCEAGRLRAFENAYLLERAQARTRKQLAALHSQH